MNSAELIEEITASFRSCVQKVLVDRGEWRKGSWLYDAECAVQKVVKETGRKLLELLVDQLRGGHVGQWHTDEEGQKRRFKDYRKLMVRTRVGVVCVKRAKYESALATPRGLCPMDAHLGLRDSCSMGLEELIAFTTAQLTYEQSLELLSKTLGVELSVGKVKEVAGHWGQKASERYREQLPREKPEARMAVGVDGAKLRTSERRRKRKGSRKQHFSEQWREAKLGVIYRLNRQGRLDRGRRYVATLGNRDAFAKSLWDRIECSGADRAKEVVWLGDGAPWIWGLKDEILPHAVEILDFVHAKEHLHQVCRAVYGAGKRGSIWLDRQIEQVLHGDAAKVTEELIRLGKRLGRPPKKAADQDSRKVVADNIGYFQTNASRMDYRTYRERGYPISSGVVESGCKQIVTQRMKMTASMSWTEAQAENVLQLRCLVRSSQWEHFWDLATSAA